MNIACSFLILNSYLKDYKSVVIQDQRYYYDSMKLLERSLACNNEK
jgi:hypothetical protein